MGLMQQLEEVYLIMFQVNNSFIGGGNNNIIIFETINNCIVEGQVMKFYQIIQL